MGVTAVEKLGKVSGEGVNVGKEGRILMKFSNVYDDKFENFHGHPDLSATTERVYYIFTREKEEKSEHAEEKGKPGRLFLRTPLRVYRKESIVRQYAIKMAINCGDGKSRKMYAIVYYRIRKTNYPFF